MGPLFRKASRRRRRKKGAEQEEQQHAEGLTPTPKIREDLATGARPGQGRVGRSRAGFLVLSLGRSPEQSQAAGAADGLVSTHPPSPPLYIDTLPQARPGALGFPQSHSCLHSSCRCDSQAGAGSHAVCGHALGLGASCGREPAAHTGTGQPPTHGCPAGGLGSLEVPELRRVRNSPSQVYPAPSGHPPSQWPSPPPLLKVDVPVPRPPHWEEVGGSLETSSLGRGLLDPPKGDPRPSTRPLVFLKVFLHMGCHTHASFL